jgi:ATP-dependent Clp protease ATP-binding subunit ClpA
MKISMSTELVWQIAAREAAAGEFKEIEPEHFLLALLKFSELPVEEVGKIAAGTEAAGELTAELNATRETLINRSIESKPFRRQLRTLLGKGGYPYDSGKMHRSKISRELFNTAARLATDVGKDVLTTEHLLEAIFVSPPSAIVRVLGDDLGQSEIRPSKTPLLDEYGRDLTKEAVTGELPVVSGRKAESNALIRALTQVDPRCVFLISNNDADARSVVLAAAGVIGAEGTPSNIKSKRIVDVTGVKSASGYEPEIIDRLERIFAESANETSVILYLPAIEDTKGTISDSDWLKRLKLMLGKEAVQCICRLAPAVHQKWIVKDSEWRRLAEAMWVYEEARREVPAEI